MVVAFKIFHQHFPALYGKFYNTFRWRSNHRPVSIYLSPSLSVFFFFWGSRAAAVVIIAWPKSFIVVGRQWQLCQWLPCGINEPRTSICLTKRCWTRSTWWGIFTLPFSEGPKVLDPGSRVPNPTHLAHGIEAAPNALHCKIGFCKLFGHNIYFHLNAIWPDSLVLTIHLRFPALVQF